VAQEIQSRAAIQWNHSLLGQFEADPLKYYLTRPAIVEVIGGKGSGKTALLLRLALEFHSTNPTARIKILNCAGGITLSRLSSLSKTGCEYCDIFGLEDLME
jgi:superfamily I DNA and RNA helicase